MKERMVLDKIFRKKGVPLTNEDGTFREVPDIIEDMYMRLNAFEISKIMFEIEEEERFTNVFNEARGVK